MEKEISVIIPQRNSIDTLPRLFDSIPVSEKIEIIVVDNSPTPITKNDINIDREYALYWADPQRFAGGARNVGVEHAHGKWLVFADADDFFTGGAFDTFFSLIEDEADVIYFGMTGMYEATGEFSPRGDYYTKRVRDYLSGQIDENRIRFGFGSPCSKMVRKSLVDEYQIKYDEVVACNDSFFAMNVGYYAKKIKAVDFIVYVATVSRGSLTRRRDFNALHSRYLVKLRINDFFKRHGVGKYQGKIMPNFVDCVKVAPTKIFKLLAEAIKYRQNLFRGVSFWAWLKNKGKQPDNDNL